MENKEQDVKDNIDVFSLSEKIRLIILLKTRIDIDSLNFIDYFEEDDVSQRN